MTGACSTRDDIATLAHLVVGTYQQVGLFFKSHGGYDFIDVVSTQA